MATRGPSVASLSHLCDLPLYKKETPYEIWAENIDPEITKTNVELEIVHDCVLHDVRLPSTDQPSLETHGFEWAHRPFPTECGIKTANDVGFSDIVQQESLIKYIESTFTFIKEKYGCTKVMCWDWRVRRSKSTHPRTKPNIYSLKGKEGNELRATQINSSHLIHSDGSPTFMKKVLASVTAGDDKKWNDTSKYRIRGLTVWCPIVDVVESDPLVLCDIRTVEDSDWDVVEKVLDHSVEESMYLKRRKRHQWYWMSDQTKNESIVMNIWDSIHPDSRRYSAPHCSMVLREGDIRPNARPRESIELRLLAWNELE
ncbi:hypothetical protein NLG97_g2938 [Lecanicillium saksenae]|uniref:Uncharacterized protein n=1 Tax=Lecanicillium saksenae TaxID=468837 RepID=A0ACC1R259_9HYPO|nr:hypothetical protein NLG97_g2938 [Lecanicillium saksenae]